MAAVAIRLDPAAGQDAEAAYDWQADFPSMATDRELIFTAIIKSEDDAYVALCPELDIASQGGSIEDALAHLREAVDLFLQAADHEEVLERRRGHIFVTQFLAARG